MFADNPVTTLGLAHHRYGDKPFGIRLADRQLHAFLIGQTGTGKSTLLYNVARQDAAADRGFCLIDPHGDLAASLHAELPEGTHRYWNVADPESHVGYNPLTRVSADFRPLVASGLIDTLKKQWSDAWGVRMEHLLRYAILALLEQPRTDLRDIIRLFVDQSFRQGVTASITDEQVRAFWTKEYPAMNYKTAVDGVAPIANKIGAFLAHPLVRRAVCDPAEPLRFRQMMDEGHSLIIDLAKGRLGTDVANVLGGLLMTSIMNAAFSRHDLPETERRPFMLLVDEVSSFSTLTFASMLSEARKYALSVTASQQYLNRADHEVFEAIIGNVGSLLAFRVGAIDAPIIAKQLGVATPADLVNLPNYRIMVRLMVDGQQTPPFTADTFPSQRAGSPS
ncbi:MAG: type IV secretion system DNA-binding domain-containing protein [Silicimonas sp.]|uniref:type IV secretory system conjugative DNA transfer family protein n=1 Tax=Alphaproteobacteria TaxID=28211 RepID=UPI0032ED4D8B